MLVQAETDEKLDSNLEVNLDFETAMAELETIVRELSSNTNIKLNNLVEMSKRAQVLKNFCQIKLDQAKLEIEEVSDKEKLITKASELITKL